jgi:hypothetical protein
MKISIFQKAESCCSSGCPPFLQSAVFKFVLDSPAIVVVVIVVGICVLYVFASIVQTKPDKCALGNDAVSAETVGERGGLEWLYRYLPLIEVQNATS